MEGRLSAASLTRQRTLKEVRIPPQKAIRLLHFITTPQEKNQEPSSNHSSRKRLIFAYMIVTKKNRRRSIHGIG